ETNLRADVSQLADINNEDNLKEVQGKLSRTALSLAVAVSEPKALPANDPHALMNQPPQAGQTPRMIVFGSVAFASNRNMAETSGTAHYALFTAALSWLRGRPTDIGLEPKTRNYFTLQN